MTIPILAVANAGKTAETTASSSVQTAKVGAEVTSGASSGTGAGISVTPLGGLQGRGLETASNTCGAGISGSPFVGAQSGANKGLTGYGSTDSIQKPSSLNGKLKSSMPGLKSAINKTKQANMIRKDIHGFGKDMMGQDAHRNDPERTSPSSHGRSRRL